MVLSGRPDTCGPGARIYMEATGKPLLSPPSVPPSGPTFVWATNLQNARRLQTVGHFLTLGYTHQWVGLLCGEWTLGRAGSPCRLGKFGQGVPSADVYATRGPWHVLPVLGGDIHLALWTLQFLGGEKGGCGCRRAKYRLV